MSTLSNLLSFEWPLETVSALVIITLLFSYYYYKQRFSYWKRRGVPTIPPVFPAGNITLPVLGRQSLFVRIQEIYQKLKEQGHQKHAGVYFFHGPVYMPIDPEIIKPILTSDFEHFVDRGTYINEEYPLSGHLFSLTGLEWKHLRTKLSPVYTSGKLKTMFEQFKKISAQLVDVLEPLAMDKSEINIKFRLHNFTTDIICSTVLGVDCNTLDHPEQELSDILMKLLNPPRRLLVKMILTEGFTNPGSILKVFQSNKIIEEFFVKFLKDAIKIAEQNDYKKQNTFLSALLEIRDKSGLTFNEILAESFIFFVAGFETSAATMSFCLHELAHNQKIQDKLRQELQENLGKDSTKYTYEKIFSLPYLDKVFQETLRLYPVLANLNRFCVKEYQVPGTDVIIEKGTPVLIPVLGIHRDPQYYPDPLKFDPERFSEGNQPKSGTYFPFGEGPRFCIGMRLGKLQTKMGIASLVANYKFLPSDKTQKFIEYDKVTTSPAMSPKAGIMINIEKV